MTALHTDGPVICAFEDNELAKLALRGSAWLAHELDTALLVAHAFDAMGIPVLSSAEMAKRSLTPEQLEQAARERAQRKLADAAGHVRGADVQTVIVEDQPVPGLVELAASRGARLIVTGTSARMGLDWVLAGSVTADLAANAPCPVVAIPRAAALEEPGPLVAGYDGSEHGLRAARHAAALAAELGRALVVVHVTKQGDELPGPDRELVGELLMAASEGRIAPAGGPLELDVSVVHESGDPADVLVRVARERAAALIFTGIRGRNALSSALFGSVSAGVVAVSDRPVALVPASARED